MVQGLRRGLQYSQSQDHPYGAERQARGGKGEEGAGPVCFAQTLFAERFDLLYLPGQGNAMAIIGLNAQRHREVR